MTLVPPAAQVEGGNSISVPLETVSTIRVVLLFCYFVVLLCFVDLLFC